ncbi:hypothetical protein FHY18_004345 [Xanthomonas arboricola]|nr:hypothetical protein [Xanthomonas sp. 3793]
MGAEVRALIRPAGTFSRLREKGTSGGRATCTHCLPQVGEGDLHSLSPERGRRTTCTAFSRVREKVAQSAG